MTTITQKQRRLTPQVGVTRIDLVNKTAVNLLRHAACQYCGLEVLTMHLIPENRTRDTGMVKASTEQQAYECELFSWYPQHEWTVTDLCTLA